jgi:hypothetical protein
MRRIILAVFIVFCSLSIALACGKERWPVKIGADRDAGNVSADPQASTIAELTDLRAPPNPNSRKSSRFAAELKTYRINAVLTLIKKEADEDYHIIIADPNDEELTMIVESVAPGCAEGGLFYARDRERKKSDRSEIWFSQ